MGFTVEGGKVTYQKPEKANTGGGRSLTIKVDGDRLSKLQSILTRSDWKNQTKATASDASKWYAEQIALKEIALKLLDLAIGEHTVK